MAGRRIKMPKRPKLIKVTTTKPKKPQSLSEKIKAEQLRLQQETLREMGIND
ncbi:hypothetical protein KAR91_08120 [Candidatus Pacearchaeota archaeon]|nr:hypothetical protein [Candidatus Pacearchaeota archaeon]